MSLSPTAFNLSLEIWLAPPGMVLGDPAFISRLNHKSEVIATGLRDRLGAAPVVGCGP
ncbi:MAG TPA: hypothetical protein VG269_29380 [Tepidisphaeraceae bacterium]|jgi:hypothetical protein|nr:hypothetical protein [Tepidisphaeraceae bacterium]